MNFIITSICLDIRNFYRQYFKVLLLFLISVLIIGSFFIFYPKIFISNTSNKVNVVIVNRDKNPLTPTLIQYITSVKDFSSNFCFSSESIDVAQGRLKEKSCDAIIIIPEEFLENIFNGENKPFEVHINNLNPIETAAFTELMNGASRLISLSQIGIHSGLDYLRYEKSVSDDLYYQGINGLNIYFSKIALKRKSFLHERTISPAGAFTLQEHYFLSFIVMLMFLYSIINISSIHELCTNPMVLQIKSSKISYFKIIIAKIIYIFIINFILFLSIFIILTLLCIHTLNLDISISITNIFYLIIFLILLSFFTVTCGFLFTEKNSCHIFILIITFVMTFMSGGFIPPAFLPEVFDKLQIFTLNHYCIWLLSGFVNIEMNLAKINISILSILFMLILILISARRLYGYNNKFWGW